ncbi:MAG: glycerol-3-phosphate dehydrogenase [Chlorobi bacterium]|nr:glycerol-3-phosphate dehydrogenase [Chlorobiota bacterium]
MEKIRVGVLGNGSWATAIVKMLSENTDEIGWYIRTPYTLGYILEHKHNPKYIPQIEFDISKLKLSNDINEIVRHADYLIVAIPSAFLKPELDKITEPLEDKVVFSAVKGIIPENLMILGEYLEARYGMPPERLGVIAGPCHAEEVAMERLSYLTVAAGKKEHARRLASLLESHYIKTTLSKDVHGIEWAAVLKNIYAIAAGVAHGLGYGDNFQAVLVSNAIREMRRFIKKNVDKKKRNIMRSAYLGDLLVTAYSTFSRNRLFGNMIGKGYTVKSAMMEMTMVAEGYYATKSAYLINEKKGKARIPIIAAMYDILYRQKPAKEVMRALTAELD